MDNIKRNFRVLCFEGMWTERAGQIREDGEEFSWLWDLEPDGSSERMNDYRIFEMFIFKQKNLFYLFHLE